LRGLPALWCTNDTSVPSTRTALTTNGRQTKQTCAHLRAGSVGGQRGRAAEGGGRGRGRKLQIPICGLALRRSREIPPRTVNSVWPCASRPMQTTATVAIAVAAVISQCDLRMRARARPTYRQAEAIEIDRESERLVQPACAHAQNRRHAFLVAAGGAKRQEARSRANDVRLVVAGNASLRHLRPDFCATRYRRSQNFRRRRRRHRRCRG
jgi:hypothetical protein